MKIPVASFLIYHHKSMSSTVLRDTVASYVRQIGIEPDGMVEIILLLEGVAKEQVLWIEELKGQTRIRLNVIESEEMVVGPGKLWNKGVSAATAEWLVCTWTGVIWDEGTLQRYKEQMKEPKEAIFGPVSYEVVNEQVYYTPKQVGLGELALQGASVMNTIPLCGLLVSKKVVQQIGGFEESREYARLVDWEFTKRLSRQTEIAYTWGSRSVAQNALNTIRFEYPFKQTIDEQIRTRDKRDEGSQGIKVAIISGWTEGAQVQLCLLNYLELVPESFSYRRFTFEFVNLEELVGYDRVFLVRGCSAKALEIARFCIEKEIKVTYILDDNWFCVTQTYPQMETHMGKRSIHYLYFTLLISIVDEIWVYNAYVEEDIKPYNPSTYLMPVSVALEHFKVYPKRVDQEIRIGFAGSGSKVMHFTKVFKALERIMEKFTHVTLYFKGIAMPHQFNKWGERVRQESYDQDYEAYAKAVSKWQCDIMLSPLGDTRYTNSKCINKYLEITAAGAVGVYAAIPLYQSVVVDEENGLLVSDDEEAWYNAIKQLIITRELRDYMQQNAYHHVKTQYATKQVLPLFLERIKEGLTEGEVNCEKR